MEQTLATGPLLLCCYVQVWDEHPVLLGFTAPTKEFEYSNMLRKTGLSEPKNCTFQKRHRDHPLALGVLCFLCQSSLHEPFCLTVCLESFSQNVTLQLSFPLQQTGDEYQVLQTTMSRSFRSWGCNRCNP